MKGTSPLLSFSPKSQAPASKREAAGDGRGEAGEDEAGARTDLEPSANLPKVSQADAAELLNVSERSVADAAKVRDNATPALKAAVEQGHLAVSVAAQVSELPVEDQNAADRSRCRRGQPGTRDGQQERQCRAREAEEIAEFIAIGFQLLNLNNGRFESPSAMLDAVMGPAPSKG